MSNTQRNMTFERINAFIVVVHNKRSPRDDEWEAYVKFNRAAGIEQGVLLRYLVFTEGGAPTATQRKVMHDALAPILKKNSSAIRGAIVTPSTFVRGIVTAMRIIEPIYRAFSPDEMDDAFSYIGVPVAIGSDIHAMITKLKAQLDP